MADLPTTETAVHATATTSSDAAATAATAPPAGVTVRPSTKARAAEIMANFRKEQAATAKETPAAEPAKVEAKDSPHLTSRPTAGDDDAQDEIEAKAPATEETAGKPPDADLDARLASVAKAEKRNRDALARDVAAAKAELRATLDTERAKMTAEFKSQDDARREKFRRNPVAAIREWGIELSDDDLNYIGRQFYGETKAASADPKNRDLVERARREREKDESASATQKRLEKLETELREKDQAAEAQRRADAYLTSVTKTIGAEHVVIKDMHSKNPGKATMRIAEAAMSLMQAGDEPTPAEVLAEAEKRERAELEDRGIDVAAHVARLAGGKKLDAPKPAPTTTPKPVTGAAAVTGLSGKSTRDKLAELKKREDYPKI